MRIGIDARFYGHTGIGRYIKNLLSELEKLDKTNEYIVFLKKDNFSLYNTEALNFKKVLADFKWYSFKEQIGFPLVLYKEKLDLLHIPHFNIPVLYIKPIIVTVHDLIMHKFSTEEATTLNPIYYKFKRLVYKVLVMYAFKKALQIIVPSQCVKDELLDESFFKVESKIRVIKEGLDENFQNVEYSEKLFNKFCYEVGLEKPYLLYVGSSYPHKNLNDLIIAFRDVKNKNLFEGNLVIVGKRDTFLSNLKQFTKNLEIDKYVLFPSFYEGHAYINDELLLGIYKNALAFLHPSLEEGFNLTPLEAMSCGIPCAISDICVHREIYGESVLYLKPKSVNSIEEKIIEIIKNKKTRETLIEKGNLLVKKYSFSKMAKQIKQIYEEYKV